MRAASFLQDILSTLFDRRAVFGGDADGTPIERKCADLLSSKGEISGNRFAAALISHYRALDPAGQRAFFGHLNDALDIDPDAVAEAAKAYADDRGAAAFSRLIEVAEPRRQELLRRMNQVPGATAALVAMRADLLGHVRDEPALKRTDIDFEHLLASWFNRGFLVLRRIGWETPANILEKIIAYEAVHAINDWSELRRRLEPPDRRCFAFFHPSIPDDPLVFVEVALAKGIPNSIQGVLSDSREPLAAENADTAVFYSISNCQRGLRGISFGNSLIKQVVEVLSAEFRHLQTFVTLSPVPGFNGWLAAAAKAGDKAAAGARAAVDASIARGAPADALGAMSGDVRRMAAYYLTGEKRADGMPDDPVARFHLGNGAMLHAVHALADVSPNGLRQSSGVMVNYLYDLKRIETNHEAFLSDGVVAASNAVAALAKKHAETRGEPA